MFAFLLSASLVVAGSIPNPDFIRVIQERDARERAVARRIELQIERQPKQEPKAEPKKPVEAPEVPGLREAIERFVKEGRDVPDLRK
jgi:hypothetical protein